MRTLRDAQVGETVTVERLTEEGRLQKEESWTWESRKGSESISGRWRLSGIQKTTMQSHKLFKYLPYFIQLYC